MKHVKTYEAFFGLFKKKDDDTVEAILQKIKDDYQEKASYAHPPIIKKIEGSSYTMYEYTLNNDTFVSKREQEWVDDWAEYSFFVNSIKMDISIAKKIYKWFKSAYEQPEKDRLASAKSDIANRYNQKQITTKKIDPKIASLQKKLGQ